MEPMYQAPVVEAAVNSWIDMTCENTEVWLQLPFSALTQTEL